MSRPIPIEKMNRCTLAQASEFIGARGLYAKTRHGVSAFRIALEHPNFGVAQLFLDAGLDLNNLPKNDDLWYFAMRYRHERVVSLLLDHDVAIERIQDRLCEAIRFDRPRHFKLLLPKATSAVKRQALEFALDAGRVDYIRRIMKTRLNINYWSSHEMPLLFQLIEFPQTLVGVCADFDMTDCDGRNVCHWLTQCVGLPVSTLVYVIQNGADVNREDAAGHRPLDFCCYYQRNMSYLIVLFLAGGLSFNFKTNYMNGMQIRLRGMQIFYRPLPVDPRPILAELKSDVWSAATKQMICARANEIVRTACADVCIVLQGLRLPALVTCEILQARCYMWPRIPFHCFWNLVTTVKHFCQRANKKIA